MVLRACLFSLSLLAAGFTSAASYTLKMAGPLDDPARYGLSQLEAALAARGDALVREEGAGRNCVDVGIDPSLAGGAAEALEVLRVPETSGTTLSFRGSDGVGLMYALLDAAEQIEVLPRDADWFASIRTVEEKPANPMRRARLLLHHEKNEASWYHDKAYWDWYLGALARDRWNGLNLVFSHQTPYMAPMFAWHFTVPEYPDVRGVGVSDADMKKNLETLRYIGSECARRGIELTVGVWQYLPWSEEVLIGRGDQKVLVHGLTIHNVTPYTYLATKRLLAEVPNIKRIQLRFSSETGLEKDDQYYLYKNGLFKAIAEADPPVELDMRMGGGRPSYRDAARELGIPLRISFKFNGEFMGLPHPPADVLTVGYSYGDKFVYPRPFPMYNEVWALGSHRVLLWGSEDFGRQFGRGAAIGGTIGFEVDMPMGQKGYQDETGPAWRFFENPEDEYFRYEMERYWAYLRAYGRFTYNPDAEHEVWMRPFRKRFGAGAEAMAEAYEAAGRVVGMIVATHINNTNMYAWPEKSMGGLPDAYIEIGGMDKLHFPTIKAQVEDELASKSSGAMGALALAREWDAIAESIERALGEVSGKLDMNDKEVAATVRDFQICMHLARFHADRQREGYHLAKFNATGDAGVLPEAIRASEAAVAEWKRVVEVGDRQYYDHMNCGPREVGHWKDSLFLVEAGPKLIREAEDTLHRFGVFDYGFDFGGEPASRRTANYTIKDYSNDYDVARRFTGMHTGSLYQTGTGYGFLETEGLSATSAPRVVQGTLVGDQPDPDAPLPLDSLGRDYLHSKQRFSFRLDLPMERYRYTFVFADGAGETPHGPFEVGNIGRFATSRIKSDLRVPAGGAVYVQEDENVGNDRFPFASFYVEPSEKGAEAILSGLTVHRMAPRLAHAPSRRLPPGTLPSVTITMPPELDDGGTPSASSRKGLAGATLFVRGHGGAWVAHPLSTEDGFVYRAKPRGEIRGRMEYWFQAIDRRGARTRLPEAGSYSTFVSGDTTPPLVRHRAAQRARPGVDLPIRVTATDESGLAAVRVRYRVMNQKERWETLELLPEGDGYAGVIPGAAIDRDFDFTYCIEAIDSAGNSCFYPDWKRQAPYVVVAVERP